ncbi:MAG: Regulatory protein AtoC [Calditrichaeota bacterium]|nr:Regulatory protein AtoC [Calditrichota bacterium]
MANDAISVLVVDDEKNIRRSLRMVLAAEGYAVEEASNANATRALFASTREPPDAVFLDLKLPDVKDLSLLEWLRATQPGLPVIMISGHGSLHDAVEAVKRGAFDFLEKPLERERILVTLRNALETRRLRRRVAELSGGGAIIGESPQMGDVRDWIARVAPTDGRVLVIGESGTGKELVARAIHEGSPRAGKPFIKANCAAIPKELVESVLFGHVRGAFTGALRDKLGTFKQADGGTLFLDEIADMGLEAQAKVLRVLQEGEFEPVGATKTETVDVRVIAATHRNLEDEIAQGRFREDLYYRLAVLVLELPPLREREGDVRVLARHFLAEFHEHGLPRRTLSEEALRALARHAWPGNVRELCNVIERVAILARDAVVRESDLPAEVRDRSARAPSAADSPVPPVGTSLADVRAEAERRYLEAVLAATGGNVSEAARRIGIERTHLHKKLSALGLK